MPGLTWDEFLKDAREVVRVSDSLCDDWRLEGNAETPQGAYLKRTETRKHSEIYLKWEYHVCYSPSYAVPVLFFNIWDSTGATLSMEDVWKLCDDSYRSSTNDKMYSTITQQEHPVLLRPFFVIHPCKSSEFLGDRTDGNMLVKFITSAGQLIKLTMDISYGLKK